jgi:hypothetical protein
MEFRRAHPVRQLDIALLFFSSSLSWFTRATFSLTVPVTLVVAEAREREIYGVTDQAEIDRVLNSYPDFVALCARKEAETGEPCLIIASY